jgi:3-hydroxyacyl-[acyl-carrier-protein] dehydratase
VKFHLIDRVESITATRIVAVKNVTLAEEYLADHFPSFPVLPGVMMLEALTQCAAWLLHHNSNFSKSMAVLKEARNLRYGNFVAPGHTLTLDVELFKETATGAVFKASGLIAGQPALVGRLEMAYFNLAEQMPELKATDDKLIAHNKHRWNVLTAQGTTQGMVTI